LQKLKISITLNLFCLSWYITYTSSNANNKYDHEID